MTRRDRSTGLRLLTHHFFQGFFRLSFLDDAGEESFKRAIIGILAGIVAFGLLLARIYATKYGWLSGQPTPDLYRWMLPADQLLMICLPMVSVAFVMALVSHSLFPDETDYRILMALPVSRGSIVIAKLMALLLFAGIFIISANLAIGLPFSVMSGGLWAEHWVGRRAVAQAIAGVSASVFTVAGVVAVQGIIVAATPRTWLRAVSVTAQTILVCGLVLSLPIVARLPALSAYLATEPRWLYFAPPAWFLGLQQWLLGSRSSYFERLAWASMLGTTAVVVTGAICYMDVYRRFDQVILRTGAARRRWAWNVDISWPWRRHPSYHAVQRFTSATLRRSGLHQLVFFVIVASGFALATNSVLGSIGLATRWLVSAALGAPVTLMVAAVMGLRAALLLPANIRAAWIFRLTEEPLGRSHELDAVRHALIGVGVVIPVALSFPVQAAVLGLRSAIACVPVVLLLGWILVELVVNQWRRLPFTCTVLFGKRPAAYSLSVAVIAFNLFVFLGIALQQVGMARPRPWFAVVAILLFIVAGLTTFRRQTWGRVPFEFEDSLPASLDILILH